MTISVGKITKHFSWTEATHSATAIKRGIINEPSAKDAANILKAAVSLEELRTILGDNLGNLPE